LKSGHECECPQHLVLPCPIRLIPCSEHGYAPQEKQVIAVVQPLFQKHRVVKAVSGGKADSLRSVNARHDTSTDRYNAVVVQTRQPLN